MYVHKRVKKDGSHYFGFSYLNKDGKRVRLKLTEHPNFTTKNEAEEWARSQTGIRAAKKDYIEKKLSWKSKYYNFDNLIEKYSTWQKDRAPNSWQSSVSYLDQWVFPFFLLEKKINNINNWHLFFQEFIDWLRDPERAFKRGRGKPLALNTINNIIKALNTFTTCLSIYNLIDSDAAKKCHTFPDHMLNRRDLDYIIEEWEMEKIRSELEKIHQPIADFFYVMWHTGMRFGELFGLSIASLHKGDVPQGPLKDELNKVGIKPVGYIYLDSQPYYDDRKREIDKSIKRKPLKSCKEISPKYARIIPIVKKDVWNILAVRYLKEKQNLLKKTYTSEINDYVFFDDCEWNKTVNLFKEVQVKLNMNHRGYHGCRHTYITHLVGQTRSYFCVRMITGQKSQKAFERYVHIWESVARKAQVANQLIDVI